MVDIGVGVKTKNGRCFGFYVDLKKCQLHSLDFRDCSTFYQDYQECLHHRNEKRWIKKIDNEIVAKRNEFLDKHNVSEPNIFDKIQNKPYHLNK